jgi:Protein of unknown function (DUF3572)
MAAKNTDFFEAAENQAISMLGFLAADPDRLAKFLSLTGVNPADIRSLMKDRGFWLAIIDHYFEDESLLMAYCAENGMMPPALVKLRQGLTGPHERGLRDG